VLNFLSSFIPTFGTTLAFSSSTDPVSEKRDLSFDISNIPYWLTGNFLSVIAKRRFSTLTEQEIVALAISCAEESVSIYHTYAEGLRESYPDTSKMFEGMAKAKDDHRRKLIDLHEQRFGEDIPFIRREHVSGFYFQTPVWFVENFSMERIREEIINMETRAHAFYLKTASRATDVNTRKLLGDLAFSVARHIEAAVQLDQQHLTEQTRESEDKTSRRAFILTWVQPGLAGLMDGSVSTLAPIFATAFATQDTWTTFLVGLAASVGAGISMGFTEAISDDGKLSGRGSPIKRGFASGIMTMVGGLGHALPYLITDFWTATSLAIGLVFVELWAIAWIQNRFMETPFFKAAYQVVLGGALVFAAGILIGSA